MTGQNLNSCLANRTSDLSPRPQKQTAQRQGLARGAAVSVHLTSAEKVIVFSRGDSGGWRGGWPPRERSRPWCPSSLQDGLRGQEQRRNGPSSQAALEREGLDASMTQRNPAICSKYEPPRPCPLGTPGPHTCSDTGGSPRATTVPSVLHRISRDRIPAPHRATPGPWPSRAWHAWAPASHASVRLVGARECLQSGRDAAAEATAGANSAHAGRCPRERGAFCGARIAPRAGSAELAPWGAPLSLFARRWSVQAVCADLRGLSGVATPM